jgi:transcriptional regulator with XRE-family HTH domain
VSNHDLRHGRKQARLTQKGAAARLGVSQPYLSLLEKGSRPVPQALARKATRLYRLPATALPLPDELNAPPSTSNEELTAELAALGYPGFSYVRSRKKRNPALVLFKALGQRHLDARLAEALPWVLLNYPELNWSWLVSRAKANNLQNRLGFVTQLAREVAEARRDQSAMLLTELEATLDRARLAREDTLANESMTEAEKSWLRERRPAAAQHWNLLTDLTPGHLRYAA